MAGYKFNAVFSLTIFVTTLLNETTGRNLKCADPLECSLRNECNMAETKKRGHTILFKCSYNKFCCIPTFPSIFPTPENPITTDISSSTGAASNSITEETTVIDDFSDSEINGRVRKLLPLDTCGQKMSLQSKIDEDMDQNKIYRGTEATLGEVPWVALLGIKELSSGMDETCGGTLISSTHIITAAHCLYKNFDISNIKIFLGGVNIKKMKKCFKNSLKCNELPPLQRNGQGFVHEKYNETTKENDIALIKMDEPVTFNDFIQPACLPFDDLGHHLESRGNALLTAGWGRKGQFSKGSRTLQKTKQYAVPFKNCSSKFRSLGMMEPIFKSQICTLGINNTRALQGDSGGPLLLEEPVPENMKPGRSIHQKTIFVVVGANSYGPVSWFKPDPAPNTYTRIKKFMGWILRKIEQ